MEKFSCDTDWMHDLSHFWQQQNDGPHGGWLASEERAYWCSTKVSMWTWLQQAVSVTMSHKKVFEKTPPHPPHSGHCFRCHASALHFYWFNIHDVFGRCLPYPLKHTLNECFFCLHMVERLTVWRLHPLKRGKLERVWATCLCVHLECTRHVEICRNTWHCYSISK